ncbi:MAG: transcriptional repressor [Oscillospiraceae bacterium]|nr:transcriptional repressor [Oscillospiraceae bacterium]
MRRPANYNTKQREAILDYIISLDGAHVTAGQIVKHFSNMPIPIGRTTIYRHLDKLMETGKLRRYTTDGVSGVCYQYIGDEVGCYTHFHLKCEDCGELIHMECNMLGRLEGHILKEHSFQINALKTVLYGQCSACSEKE